MFRLSLSMKFARATFITPSIVASTRLTQRQIISLSGLGGEHRNAFAGKPLGIISSRQYSRQHESSLVSRCITSDDVTVHKDDTLRNQNGYEAAQQAVSILAQRTKTWKRLAPIVELATSSPALSTSFADKRPCIADIGCDHGLLSIALAASGNFEMVIGADVSENALNNGAREFHRKAAEELEAKESDIHLPVEFRVGNGLESLEPGKAQAICLAGMGVNTMLSILDAKREESFPESAIAGQRDMMLLDYVQCKCLFLQAPTSHPRQLMKLYKNIQERDGWVLSDERIMKLKKKWYITMSFDRLSDINADGGENASHSNQQNYLLPGHFLARSPVKEQRIQYDAYIEHHLRWLNNDLKQNGNLCDDEMKTWMDANLIKDET